MISKFDLDERFDQYWKQHRDNPMLWRSALRESLARLNEYRWSDVLDIGGGIGALEQILVGNARYWLVDKSCERVESCNRPRRFTGNAENLPFPDASFDLVISISTLQYIDHAAFFRECVRVLRPGGVLAIHENGNQNPVIKLARVVRRRVARHSAELRRYLKTINFYYEPTATPHFELRCAYAKAHFLLSPVSYVIEAKGYRRLARLVEAITIPLDKVLMLLPGAQNRAWWTVQHFIKSDAAT